MAGLLDRALTSMNGVSRRLSGNTNNAEMICSNCTKRYPRNTAPKNNHCSNCANQLQPLPPSQLQQQHMQQAPAQTQAFVATIPNGVKPGEQFAAFLNGEKRVFVCPPGAGPGSKVQVLVPMTGAQQQQQRQQQQRQQRQQQQQQQQQQQRTSRASSKSSNDSNNNHRTRNSASTKEDEFVIVDSPAWKCKWCQADNNGKHLACKLCGQPKGVQAQNNQPKQCAHCTFDNPSTAVKCEACERPLSVSASDGWKCGNCTLVNKDELTNCGVCDTIRSGGGNGGGGGNGFGGGGNSNNTNYESKMATDNKSSSNTPLDKAVALLMAGSNDNKVRTMLKKECGLSMGKAQKVLREAKKKRKEGSNNISESKVQTLRVPSNSVNCGICDERIRRGDRGTGKAATSATNLCEHYFCFTCLGGYVKRKINAGDVDEDDMDCPDSSCTCSMLQDAMGQFTPNYLFTSNRGSAGGILGQAFDFKEAETLNAKFLNHRNRDSNLFITCPNPRCEIPVYVPEHEQFFRCETAHHGCGKSFCKNCKRKAHPPVKDCEQAKLLNKADDDLGEMIADLIAKGGRYCPKCAVPFAAEDDDPDKWPCDHITCPCGYEFCRNCGCDRSLVVANDNSWHVSKCGLFDDTGCAANSGKPKDWPRVWKEKDPQFNGKGETYFNAFPQYKSRWKKLGTLKTRQHPIQGYFRKCQPDCKCAYGSGHCKFQMNKK